MTTAKTAAELERMIMSVVIKDPACQGLIGVTVTRADGGADGTWDHDAIHRDWPIPFDCTRAIIAIVGRLRQRHHLLTDA